MRLREFFSEDAIKLELESTSKDAVLKELVELLVDAELSRLGAAPDRPPRAPERTRPS